MNVHDLINYERKKRGISHVYWSRQMARFAKSQANYCAKVGHLVHSNRFAFQGGENLAGGAGNFSPRTIVNCWLNSKAGHREYLLSPRVKKAGVGIAKSGGKTFVAWAFSDSPPSYPDCPYYKLPKLKLPNFQKVHDLLKMELRTPPKLSKLQNFIIKLFLILLVLAGFGLLVRYSYLVFTRPTDSIRNSIFLIIVITALILLINIMQKRYKLTRPSSKTTKFFVIAISLIFVFTSVPLLAEYKDYVPSWWSKLSHTWSSTIDNQKPSGTYYASTFIGPSKLTFKGDTLIADIPIVGTIVGSYQYEKEEDKGIPVLAREATTLSITNLATDEIYYVSFKYYTKEDIVVLEGISHTKQ